MSIILRNKYYVLALGLLFAINIVLYAEKPDSLFSISVDATPGLTANIESGKITQVNFAPSFRLFWKPNHLLNIGIETSFLKLDRETRTNIETEFGTTYFKAKLNAIPILLVFNMKVWHVDVYGGMGVSYVTSKVEAFDTKVIAHIWRYAYCFGVGYTYPIKRFGIGVEARMYSFAKLEKTMIGIMPKLTYDFYKW
jgi:hypothetical protein